MERPLTGQLLLVGEGDFSLSVALVHHLSQNEATSGHAIISTSIETDESILKHKDAPDNIKWLQHRGVTIYLETDARKLHESSQLMLQRFDRIVFNFPHAGGKSNHKKNRKLLNDFFASSSKLLTEKGQIMVTLCKGQGGTPADKPMRKWHDSWQVVSMAANASLLLVEVVPFDAAEFVQYKCTGFRSQDKGFNTQGAITHIFEKGTPVQIPNLEDFKCEESYIPGQNYFQEKYSRNLLKLSFHPLQMMDDLLRKKLQTAFSFHGDSSQTQSNNFLDGKCTMLREESTGKEFGVMETMLSCSEKAECASSEELIAVIMTEELYNVISTLCLCDKPSASSGIFRQTVSVDNSSFPVHHVLTFTSLLSNRTAGSEDIQQPLRDCIQKAEEVISSVIREEVKFSSTQISQESYSVSRDLKYYGSYHILTFSGEKEISTSTPVGDIYIFSGSGCENFVLNLNLDIIVCHTFSIPHPSLLWSKEDKITQQFKDYPKSYRPTSLYPMKFTHDMSFWESSDVSFEETLFFNVIRDVGGDCITHMTLIDRYFSHEMNKYSRCYRLEFQSFDRVLSYDTSWKLQSIIRLLVAETMRVTLR